MLKSKGQNTLNSPFLKYQVDVSSLEKQLRPILGLIFWYQKYLPKKILILIYNSFVNSKLSYAIEAWGNAAGLVVFQKEILRIINFEPFLFPSLELFSTSNILSILNLYKFKTLFRAYSLFHFPDIPHTTFVQTTRQSSMNLPLPISLSTWGHWRTTDQEAFLWNGLSVSLRALTPKFCFRRELRGHLQCWGCCL